MTGRPSLLTEDVATELLRALRVGATVEVACAHAGISESTYYAWCQRGRAAAAIRDEVGPAAVPPLEQRYLDFLEGLPRAMANAEVSLLARMHEHARERWNPAAWLLEHRYPERYAGPRRLEVAGVPDAPLQVEGRHAHVQLPVPDAPQPLHAAAPDVERARTVLAALADTGLLAAAALPPGDTDTDDETEDT